MDPFALFFCALFNLQSSEKVLTVSSSVRSAAVVPEHPDLSIVRQYELLGISRSAWYAGLKRTVSQRDVSVMAMIDRIDTEQPSYGSRRIAVLLRQEHGLSVNPKRVKRLMRQMGIAGVTPTRSLSTPAPGHKVYPYLLRNVEITRVNQVWSSDITYIPVNSGFLYLVAIIDWYSRKVLAWNLSNSLDAPFCVDALREALTHATSEVINTDQGSQFTSEAFTGVFEEKGVRIGMDGRGRALDNVFVERLRRTVKYENVYLNGFETAVDVYRGLRRFFEHCNHRRPHQSLGYRTPEAVYREAETVAAAG